MRSRILLLAACVLLAVFAYDGVVRLLLSAWSGCRSSPPS